MLEAHLDSEFEGATRNFVFVFRSADWIAKLASHIDHPKFSDLGCGPGIYAKESADRQGYQIEYRYMDYLKMDDQYKFDVLTTIYCDYSGPNDREIVLDKVHHALKPGGIFILDTFTPTNYADYKEERKTTYRNSGFRSADPHVAIQTNECYPTDTFLEQYLILTQHDLKRYHNWNQSFTPETLSKELSLGGLKDLMIYANMAGDPYKIPSDTVCIVCRK